MTDVRSGDRKSFVPESGRCESPIVIVLTEVKNGCHPLSKKDINDWTSRDRRLGPSVSSIHGTKSMKTTPPIPLCQQFWIVVIVHSSLFKSRM